MSGVKDVSTAIWLASLTAFINFAFTLVGLYLVDKIGRRKLTLGSLLGKNKHNFIYKFSKNTGKGFHCQISYYHPVICETCLILDHTGGSDSSIVSTLGVGDRWLKSRPHHGTDLLSSSLLISETLNINN